MDERVDKDEDHVDVLAQAEQEHKEEEGHLTAEAVSKYECMGVAIFFKNISEELNCTTNFSNDIL